MSSERPLGRVRGITAATALLCVAWSAIAVAPVSAQTTDLAGYRPFHLGMTAAAVGEQVGADSQVKVIHQRPALIEELVWYPPRALGALSDHEAVRQIVFSF